jgi:hypothetical protein
VTRSSGTQPWRGADAADVVEHGGLDDLDQSLRAWVAMRSSGTTPHTRPPCARRGGLVLLGEGDGALVLRPQVAGEVVALGDQLVPAVAVEAPAGVEQLHQAPGDGGLGVLGRVAGLRDERVGEPPTVSACCVR